MIRAWLLAVTLLLLTACDRTDQHLASNPELVDPDRGRAPAPTTQFVKPDVPRKPTVTTRSPERKPRTPRISEKSDRSPKSVSVSVPEYQFSSRGVTSRPAIGPTGPEQRTSGLMIEAPEAMPGYILLTMLKERRAVLMSNTGKRVKTWQGTKDLQWTAARLLPDGDLIVAGVMKDGRSHTPANAPRFVERLSWDGESRWRNEMMCRSNVALRTDGKVSVLQNAYRIDVPYTLPEGAEPLQSDVRHRDDVITVLSAEGEELRTISLHDAITSSELKLAPRKVRPSNAGPWVNPYNASSLEWGQSQSPDRLDRESCVLVTMLNQATVAVVDTETQKIAWSWTSPAELNGVTYAQFLENGNILAFAKGINLDTSRVLEIDPTNNEIVWSHQSSETWRLMSTTGGSAQRLPNGNTLICSFEQGDAFEVDPEGEVVWRFRTLANRLGQRKPLAGAWRYNAEQIEGLLERLGSDIADEPEAEATNEDEVTEPSDPQE